MYRRATFFISAKYLSVWGVCVCALSPSLSHRWAPSVMCAYTLEMFFQRAQSTVETVPNLAIRLRWKQSDQPCVPATFWRDATSGAPFVFRARLCPLHRCCKGLMSYADMHSAFESFGDLDVSILGTWTLCLLELHVRGGFRWLHPFAVLRRFQD